MASLKAANFCTNTLNETEPLLPTINFRANYGYSNISGDSETVEECNRKWRIGICLAVLSGVLFTATNFLIQYYDVNAFEILMVRSVLQTVILGLIVFNSNGALIPQSHYVKFFMLLQAVVGGFRLYFNFTSLAYMPLGDALTLVFTEPLFTVVLSFIILRIGITVWKALLSASLVAGMILSIQPPFLFPSPEFKDPEDANNTAAIVSTLLEEEDPLVNVPDHGTSDYYFGVAMALSCAICGALCNILINKCEGISSTALVFYTGVAGILISVVGCSTDNDEDHLVERMSALTPASWSVLVLISFLGVLAYLCMTQALKTVSPTSVSVMRGLEIILAYVVQVVVMGQVPNLMGIFGALIVMGSVMGIAVEEKLNST